MNDWVIFNEGTEDERMVNPVKQQSYYRAKRTDRNGKQTDWAGSDDANGFNLPNYTDEEFKQIKNVLLGRNKQTEETLRDKFAMAAMAAHEPERLGLNPNEVAAYVYEIADTMLKERER